MMHYIWKLISYCCITQISWLQKWMVIIAWHRWCIKLRHIRDMAETLLAVKDENGNRNSSPTFLFSIWCHPRTPRVSKNMDTSCRRNATTVREPGNQHRFAVAVLEDKTLCTIGHLPGEISSQFVVNHSFFLVVQDLSLFTPLVAR